MTHANIRRLREVMNIDKHELHKLINDMSEYEKDIILRAYALLVWTYEKQHKERKKSYV